MPIRALHRLRVNVSGHVAPAPRWPVCRRFLAHSLVSGVTDSHFQHHALMAFELGALRHQYRNQSSKSQAPIPVSLGSSPDPSRFDPEHSPNSAKSPGRKQDGTSGAELQYGADASQSLHIEHTSGRTAKKVVISFNEAALLAREVCEFGGKEALRDPKLELWLAKSSRQAKTDSESHFTTLATAEHHQRAREANLSREAISDSGAFRTQWDAILGIKPEPLDSKEPADGDEPVSVNRASAAPVASHVRERNQKVDNQRVRSAENDRASTMGDFFSAKVLQREEKVQKMQAAQIPQHITQTMTTKSSVSESTIEPQAKHTESHMDTGVYTPTSQDPFYNLAKGPKDTSQLMEARPESGIESPAKPEMENIPVEPGSLAETKESSGIEPLPDPNRPYAPKLLMDLVDMRRESLEGMGTSELFHLASRIDAIPAYRLPRMVARLALAKLANDLKVDTSFNEASVFLEAERYLHDTADLESWTSIVLDSSPKGAIEQFVSAERHHPIFLLNFVVRPNLLLTREDLRAVVEYMAKWYSSLHPMEPTEKRDANKRTGGEPGQLRDRRQILFREIQPDSFSTTISRLAFHCFRVCPDVLPSLARVAADIITKVIPMATTPAVQYRAQCRTFNAYLQAFVLAADRNGRRYMHWTWESLRHLLSTSNSLKIPLRLQGKSFRAIRITLAGLEKTPEERTAAATLTNLWPPYRIDRDGMDQQRDAEVHATRTLKAGLAMQEAGYAKRTADYALDIVGGRSPAGTPTIQTRANFKRLLRRSADTLGPQMLWATEIKATRSVQEAWHRFSHPPPGCQRTHEIYAEMLTKLCTPLDEGPTYQAGDGRSTVPVRIPNLSDFEKARTQPPTVDNLLRMMAREGVRARGHLLTVMLRHSRTLEEARRFIRKSALHQNAIDFFVASCGRERLDDVLFDMIPFGIFSEYVQLLLRFHPRRTGQRIRLFDKTRFQIQRAMELVVEYSEIARTRPFFHTEIRSLWMHLAIRWAKSHGVWLPSRAEPVPEFRDLFWNLRVTLQTRIYVTLDNELFDRTVRGVLNSVARYIRRRANQHGCDNKAPSSLDPINAFIQPQSTEVEVPETVEELDVLENNYISKRIGPMQVLRATSDMLARDFAMITGQGRFLDPAWPGVDDKKLTSSDGVSTNDPIRFYAFHGWDAHKYMKALAVLGDYPRMEQLVKFCALELCRWDKRLQPPGNESSRAYYHLGNALCVFRGLGEPFARSQALDRARAALTEKGLWPSDEDVHRYFDGTELMEWLMGTIYQLRKDRGVWDLDTGRFAKRSEGVPLANHVAGWKRGAKT